MKDELIYGLSRETLEAILFNKDFYKTEGRRKLAFENFRRKSMAGKKVKVPASGAAARARRKAERKGK